MTIVELSVHMDCPGCEKKIRKALQKLDGVENVDIDMEMQKVTVTGWVDQEKVLKTVTKSGRKAELWQIPFNPNYHNFNEYFYDQYQLDPNPPTNYYQYRPEPDQTTNYYQYRPEFDPPASYHVPDPPVSSYNYNVHGYYNGHDYQSQPAYSVFDQPTSSMFSDENAHACSIM